MSENKTTWETRAKEYAISLDGFDTRFDTLAYLKGIEHFKEALKKEIDKEIGALEDEYSIGLVLAYNLIDTVQPIQDDTEGNKQEE